MTWSWRPVLAWLFWAAAENVAAAAAAPPALEHPSSYWAADHHDVAASPQESGKTLLCKDPNCSLMTWRHVEPKNISAGSHIFEIKPTMTIPPEVFGISKKPRPFLLYVPSKYKAGTPATLWVHAPGTAVKMETVYHHNKIFAEKNNIAMLFLSGLSYKMNVVDEARSHLGPYPDDVSYTQVCLRQVFEKMNIDQRRVFCVGFSRGARFCSRLSSELSVFFAAMAGVAGLRYPVPNNATKAIPVVAFHGVHDAIDPYPGGGPFYWGESIPTTIERWGDFNGCSNYSNASAYEGIDLLVHSNCTNNASIVLYKLLDRGHAWPVGLPINVRTTIREFFDNHSDAIACHTVVEGDSAHAECYKHMQWVKQVALLKQAPEEELARSFPIKAYLHEGLTENSTLREIQKVLHLRVYANCPFPCPTGRDSGAAHKGQAHQWNHYSKMIKPEDPSSGQGHLAAILWTIAGVLLLLALAAAIVAAILIRRSHPDLWMRWYDRFLPGWLEPLSPGSKARTAQSRQGKLTARGNLRPKAYIYSPTSPRRTPSPGAPSPRSDR